VNKRQSEILDSIGRATVKNDSLRKKFSPIICSVWDCQDFFKKEMYRSLIPADSLNPYIVTMNIENEKIIGNKVIVGVSYSNRSGDDVNFEFFSKSRPNRIAFNSKYELGYQIIPNDTILYLFYKDQSEAKVFKFTKTLNYFPRFTTHHKSKLSVTDSRV
jgi:hypothetical protein